MPRFYLKYMVPAVIMLFGLFGYLAFFNSRADRTDHLNVRLEWLPQAQFAGFIAAHALGYYKEERLDVTLRPSGPDLRPLSTVASGADQVGIAVSNQVALARANSVPVKIIAQLFQDSANRYILLNRNRIAELPELKGKPVGLWLGGDEAEFISMLSKSDMKLADVKVVPQGFSVAPFLRGEYVLSEVTVYNELIQIENQVGGKKKLQIIEPASYNSAIVGDAIIVTEATIAFHRNELVRFLRATMRGWRYCFKNPDEAIELVLRANRDLKREEQKKQFEAIKNLMEYRVGSNNIGTMNEESYVIMLKVLDRSGQLKSYKGIDAKSIFDDSLLLESQKKITQ